MRQSPYGWISTTLLFSVLLSACGRDPDEVFAGRVTISQKNSSSEEGSADQTATLPGVEAKTPQYLPDFLILRPMKPQKRWGLTPSLKDITTHLPPEYGNTYYDDDEITWAHETTHAIHSYIRNYLRDISVGSKRLLCPARSLHPHQRTQYQEVRCGTLRSV